MTYPVALARARLVWPSVAVSLAYAYPMRPEDPEWYVELDGDDRLHGLAADGSVVCGRSLTDHGDCAIAARWLQP